MFKINSLSIIIIFFIFTLFFIISSFVAFPEENFIKNEIRQDSIYGKNNTITQKNDDEISIEVNFAGNPSDLGGPYWAYVTSIFSPGNDNYEDGMKASNGYYTNDSYQQEDWMYINISVSSEHPLVHVWLNWLHGKTWTNWTYEFTHISGEYYELWTNKSNITTQVEYPYSFDVVANNSLGYLQIKSWEKIGIGGNLFEKTRRYVYLNCTKSDSFIYNPFYFHDTKYSECDYKKRDRMHHDQGVEITEHDTNILNTSIPNNDVSYGYCGSHIGYWFDESICIEDRTLENIYYHIWWSSEASDRVAIGWGKSRGILLTNQTVDFYYANIENCRSSIVYDDIYHLDTHLLDITNTLFSDNSIYEFGVCAQGTSPSIISNRSFPSFILFNIPDNETLNASYDDSDFDDLSDWTELYRTYTNPFLIDTDNDCATDYDEAYGEEHGYWNSDPNDYLNTTAYRHVYADANGPYEGLVNQEIQFFGNATRGTPPYQFQWDFCDGNYSTEQNPIHSYRSSGTFNVTLTVIDCKNDSDINIAYVTIADTIPPVLEIIKPINAIYIKNSRLFSFFFPLIIGNIDIEVKATDDQSDINRVEFYLDTELKATDTKYPYSFIWDEKSLIRYKHTIKIIVYDNAGNNSTKELNVLKFL